jgi:hypothetical protein
MRIARHREIAAEVQKNLPRDGLFEFQCRLENELGTPGNFLFRIARLSAMHVAAEDRAVLDSSEDAELLHIRPPSTASVREAARHPDRLGWRSLAGASRGI